MATNLPSCFSIQFLEQLLKFLVKFTLLKYFKSQRSYGFLITKELIFGFQILDLKDHFSASLSSKIKLIQQRILKAVPGRIKIREAHFWNFLFTTPQLALKLSLVRQRHPTICLPMKHCTEFTCKIWQRGSMLNQLIFIFCSFIFFVGSCPFCATVHR